MQPLLILTGPTAVGKSRLAVKLARAVDGEIISADSMQVYRHMDIGSAKITKEEMDGVPHHLIDVLEPEETFNVTVFQHLAVQAMKGIYERGRIPILSGGTGFYIQSVLYGIDFAKTREDSGLRSLLEAEAQDRGCAHLHKRLAELDPESAAAIHPNNVKRVIRALEFYLQTGIKISDHNRQERHKAPAYRSCYFVVNEPRNLLYDRIDRRVDQMIGQGLILEVEALKRRGLTRDMVSMQGLGYKEILAYLDGETTLEEAVRLIKRDTRHFAKRQLTWFRREREVLWVDKQEFEQDEGRMTEYMMRIMKENGIEP